MYVLRGKIKNKSKKITNNFNLKKTRKNFLSKGHVHFLIKMNGVSFQIGQCLHPVGSEPTKTPVVYEPTYLIFRSLGI